MKKIFMVTSLIFLLSNNLVFADPAEYLFKNESLGQTDMIVEVNDQNYTIYNIDRSQEGNLLLIDSNGFLPSDGIIQKSIVTYYTYLYINNHEEEIESHFHITANKLDKEAKSNYQKILDTFKSLSAVCVDIPPFQLLQVCVKPSDKLSIMKVTIVVVKLLPDWNIALNNYKNLGGNILYFTDKSDTMRYGFTEDLYSDIIATYSFLTVVEEVTGEKFTENDIIKPEKIANEVGKSTELEFNSIKLRLFTLKDSEKSKFDQVKSKIKEISILMKDIARINGDLDDIKTKNTGLKGEIALISLNDQKLRSDIDDLDNILLKAEELRKQAENSYTTQQDIYQKERWDSKAIDYVMGLVRSMVY
ncbi:hypothetical protein HY638_01140 [Candidatus Woesearchaeota archaeon]|nr:hypothetical protein [Candidatus Woesearchaeota archaeon]